MTEKNIKFGLIIVAIILFGIALYYGKPEDTRVLSKSGSMQVLTERGAVTMSGNGIIYDYDNINGISKSELEALVTLSNDSTMVFLVRE